MRLKKIIKTDSYFCSLILVGLLGCAGEISKKTEIDQWETQAAQVEIIRDDFGVPHIYGKTDADAVFGLLYAQCEDDFHRVERNYIWAIGRLAEVIGEEALYSDLRAHLFMTQNEAIDAYEASPKWLQDLCDAFAAGINYYLYTHPEVKPELLTHFEPWMPFYFSEGSIGGDIERVPIPQIKAFYEGAKPLSLITNDPLALTQEYLTEPQGSNGIAIGRKLTTSGNTLLLINPHTSFFFRGEVHMVSEEGLNAYGAVTWGQFFVYQGFNEKVGWMHTSTYTDVIDEFVEEVHEKGGGYYYKYGEEMRPLSSYEVKLKYKQGDKIMEKSVTAYRTHHGPITHTTADKWTSTALMWKPIEALTQSYIRTKVHGLKEFNQMMDMRTNSSNNTVYADAQGNIAYYHGNFIPKRDIKFDYSKPVDGSNPATDWQGLHTVAEAIKVINPLNGWIQNCNSTPFTSADQFSPKKKDYPYYMSKDEENFRGLHAIRLLKESVDMDLDKLITLAYDPYLPAFEILIPGLIKAYDQSEKEALLSAPIEVLRHWDFAVSKESIAMTLAHYYGTHYVEEGVRPSGLKFIELVQYWSEASPVGERLAIFKKAIAHLNEDFGSWNQAWGQINRYQRLNGAIMQNFSDEKPSLPIGLASGNWGALAAYGARYDNNTKKMYGTRGNSFVAVVSFGDRLQAKSILAGGQSSAPNSPHFDDQIALYADHSFKEVSFYREDVEAQARLQYHPGAR